MKKGFALIFVFAFLLTSCGNIGSEIKTEATTVHAHTWVPATCTAPKTCSVCGETEGDSISHIYEEGVCTICGSEDPVQKQRISGLTAYLNLTLLKVSCDRHIEKIRAAWYYYIHSNEYTQYYTYTHGKTYADNSIQFYAGEVGLKEEVVREAIESYIQSIGKEVNDTNLSVFAGKTLESAIYIVQYAYKNIIKTNADILQDAREALSEMSEEYEAQTNYSVLKQFLVEMKSYVDFCRSPNGSYNGLLQTKAQFQANTTRYYNELSLTYE